MPTKGMRINTSRTHLPLHHHLQGFQVFEVRNVEMCAKVNAYFKNVVTPCPIYVHLNDDIVSLDSTKVVC